MYNMIKLFSFQGFEGGAIHKNERSLDHQNADESGNRVTLLNIIKNS